MMSVGNFAMAGRGIEMDLGLKCLPLAGSADQVSDLKPVMDVAEISAKRSLQMLAVR
jgi:hypothetical protein